MVVKILYFAPERIHTLRFIERFKSEFDVVFVSYERLPSDVRQLPMPFQSRYLRWVPLLNIGHLKRIIAKENPDIVHAMYLLPWGYYASCAVSRPAKLVISPWGSDVYQTKFRWTEYAVSISGVFNRWHRRIAEKFDVCIAECEHVKKRMGELGYDKERIRVIPWGPDCSIFTPELRDEKLRAKMAPDKEVIVGCTRMFWPEYGVDRLIRAMKYVDKNVGLVLIGEGGYAKRLQRLCRTLGLEKDVFFLGRIPYPEIARYVASFDIMVSASLSDTISISVLEGMACALPVISSNVGGTSEWIRHEENGILLPESSPDEISRWVRRLSADRQMRRDLGTKARETILQRGDWRKTSTLISDVYRSV